MLHHEFSDESPPGTLLTEDIDSSAMHTVLANNTKEDVGAIVRTLFFENTRRGIHKGIQIGGQAVMTFSMSTMD